MTKVNKRINEILDSPPNRTFLDKAANNPVKGLIVLFFGWVVITFISLGAMILYE